LGRQHVKILVVGSGGREHAIAWHLTSEGADVLLAPGNGGTSPNVPLQVLELSALVDFAATERFDLTIVGPEAPLAAGLVDQFAARGLKAFGPTQAAARLEWSKAWTKDFLRRQHIPTGAAEVASSETSIRAIVSRVGLPVVLKADGLAAGKGVFVVTRPEQLDPALQHLFGLGEAASAVLVEEYLEGSELSVLAFSDGQHFAVMPPARDYKRLLDDDRGPNTGGMGGYTRPTYATPQVLADVERTILRPTLDAMLAEDNPYRGVLYAGLMLTRDGPKVLEFNCRFGDPECQLILPLLDSSLAEVCLSVIEGALNQTVLRWRDGRTYGVVLAAHGYPDAPETGDAITGLDSLPSGITAFHAGTRRAADGQVVTAGGRVLTLVGGDRMRVVDAAEHLVTFEGKQFRSDIGVEVQAAVGAAR
jgi:phosphoribosylamine--glycine ligase